MTDTGTKEPLGEPGLTARPATDVMSRFVVAVSHEASLVAALEILVAAKVRQLAVVDPAGRCLGVLADRTIAAEWARGPAAFDARRVRDVLAAESSCVPRTASVADVAVVMRRGHLDAVAVLDEGGHVVGIVTVTDLVELLAQGEAA